MYTMKLPVQFCFFSIFCFWINHTKTDELLFYLILILINLSRLVYCVFLNSITNRFSEKKVCCMIVWFGSFFCCYKLITNLLCFLTFPIISPKTALFINLKKYSSKSFLDFFLRFAFISTYGFNQVFWLNLMFLCTV